MTLGDADFRKFPMKMIHRKLSKTASLPVTRFLPRYFFCLIGMARIISKQVLKTD